MENQIIGNDSEFCGCAGETQITVFVPTPDGKGKMLDGGKPKGEYPDFCETCGKPIEKRKIIIQLCGEATKDPFPNE
jgi:hypothetical protein